MIPAVNFKESKERNLNLIVVLKTAFFSLPREET
jgi:hypothetical protein